MKKYNTKAYELPEDIVRFVRSNVAKRLLKFALISAFCVVVLWYYRGDILPFWLSFRRGILFTVLIVSPFAVTGVPFCFIDSNWRGEVIDISYFTAGSIWSGASAGKSSARLGTKSIVYRTSDSKKLGYNARYTVAVTVKRSDGSIKKEKVSNYGGAISSYSVGDTVIHFKGIKGLLIVSKKDDGVLNCIVCGCNNPKTRDNCFGCGYSLLNDYDTTDDGRENH